MRPLFPQCAFGLLLAFPLAPPAPLRADTAVRLTDLEPGDEDGLNGLDAAVVSGALYFVGRNGAGQEGLYRYDGTNPPALLADSVAARPRELTAWQGKLYFQGGPSNDRELWRYDPVGATFVEALDLRPTGNGNPQRFAAPPGLLCFSAFTDNFGFEPHCWDGTNPPTVLDLTPGASSSAPLYLTPWNGALALVNETDAEGLVLTWDGSGAAEPIDPGPGEPYSNACCLSAIGTELYFQAQDGSSFYRIFGHAESGSPARVSTTFEPGGFIGSFRGQMVTDGEDPALGVLSPELWRRVAGALRRVRPGDAVAGTDGHVEVAGASYFTGYPSLASDDRDLYKYCGAGPVGLATPAFAGDAASVVGDRAVGFLGRVYVSATDGLFGEELWEITPDHLFCDDFETGGTSSWP